ncbi:MAG: WxcM-like domain-containing protein, partial [Prevotella sp.]|nr:WxcM-like domain-containing protein [Prevotella sp.]
DVNIWRTLDDFSSGSLCLVLASHKFEEEDYIREYDEYLRYARHHV